MSNLRTLAALAALSLLSVACPEDKPGASGPAADAGFPPSNIPGNPLPGAPGTPDASAPPTTPTMGGTGGAMGSSPIDGTPPRILCEMLAYRVCGKEVECGAATDTSACASKRRMDTRCAEVKSVSARWEDCMRDIAVATCPLVMPASCKDVLVY